MCAVVTAVGSLRLRLRLVPTWPALSCPVLPCPALAADYWGYARWRAWHRFFSSMSSIFATQVGEGV